MPHLLPSLLPLIRTSSPPWLKVGGESALARSGYTDSVLDQIRQAIPGGMKSSDGSMTLKLNPPMLGRVDVNIKLKDGQITASFKVDQPVTRDILQQNMHILKDALTDRGSRPRSSW